MYVYIYIYIYIYILALVIWQSTRIFSLSYHIVNCGLPGSTIFF